MAIFLKIVSGVYLKFLWLVFVLTMTGLHLGNSPIAASVGEKAANIIAFFVTIGLSIPAVALFGFAQIIDDTRATRTNVRTMAQDIHAMRRYYEPSLNNVAE